MFPVSHGPQHRNEITAVDLTTGGANTKGSWTELLASTTKDSFGFWCGALTASASTINILTDFAIGGAGSEIAIVENFPIYRYATNGQGHTRGMFVPLWIPAGTRISARSQASSATQTTTAAIELLGPGAHFSRFGKCVTYGANTASSRGTQFDPGGSANTKGSWTEITASTSEEIKSIVAAFTGALNSARTAGEWFVDIGIGGAGSEVVLIPNILCTTHDTTDVISNVTHPLPVSIPAGTRLSVRAQSNITDATDRLLDVILFGHS